MDVEVTVRNYRCFPDTPVRFALKKGLQAFVGANNSGKSCLLRLFYELRNIFRFLENPQQIWQAMNGQQGFNPMSQVKDRNELFYDRNTRDIVVGFDMSLPPIGSYPAQSS